MYYRNYSYPLHCADCGKTLDIKLSPEDCATPEDVAESCGWWVGEDGHWRCNECDLIEEGIE